MSDMILRCVAVAAACLLMTALWLRDTKGARR